MALKIKPMPALKGKAAEDFIKKAKQVEKGISDREKKEIQDRLWAAVKFFNKGSRPAVPPSR